MSKSDVTAQCAFLEVPKAAGIPATGTIKFVCLHPDCRTYAVQQLGYVQGLQVAWGAGRFSHRELGKLPTLSLARCTACDRETVFLGEQLIESAQSDAPPPASDMPPDLIADYKEAQSILPRSPRGSAALLRLVIQKLLPALGATKSGIDAAIGELVATGKIKTPIQRALDTVRVIGNECVHPGEMDLRDDRDTALALFRIVNLIVETAITEPRRLDELYDSLPKSKLDGIAARDSKPKSAGTSDTQKKA
ncbi:DUF4145 domain-containing protein [Sphingomonas sp. BN140010]|uniref:DUF4145 domain-containing protein n=1 Tax=Sphingomonas arvum TaxID=2992113 RepID=A0ABT3JB37_9SPHN|nr:DUF4145 domain-containing protein [Sphingomonas sp. BN140010]MCW3796281.1 DUF4145 domain-containing protein [Sphingomonas sp. BN140010]